MLNKAPIILGLTGSIASGKSFVANLLRAENYPVFDADLSVHQLYSNNLQLNQTICAKYKDVCRNGKVERQLLLEHIFNDRDLKRFVEDLVHPLVEEQIHGFIAQNQAAPLIVLEVPLLLETGLERLCNKVLVITAPLALQTERALRRPQLSPNRLAAIQAAQMPEEEKIKRADYVIDSSLGAEDTKMRLQQLIKELLDA